MPPKRWLLAAYLVLLGSSQAFQWLGGVAAVPAGASRRCIDAPFFTAEGQKSASGYRQCYLEFDARPEADVVLLLHGSPAHAAQLATLGRLLNSRGGYRVLIPDLIGSGASGGYAPDYGVVAQARATLHLLDRLQVARVSIFAHSLGGGTGLHLLRLAPGRVRALVAYGSVGSQVGEGSGSYALEQFKYRLGLAVVVILPELLPHFGLFGSFKLRHTMVRNFIDTDLRQLPPILKKTRVPVLILHGAADPLVPLWAAELHHSWTSRGRLEVLNASHFLIFSEAGSMELVRRTIRFLDAVYRSESSGAPLPSGVAREPNIPPPPEAPIDLGLSPAASGWAKLVSIVVGTFVSEDLTCIAVGLSIRRGFVDLFTGLLGCYIGIVLGDLGLFFVGRLLRTGVIRLPALHRLVEAPALARLERRFEREGIRLLVLSRFVPGMRLPVYVGAGFLGGQALRMALVALAAGFVWTPLLVIAAAVFGESAARPLTQLFGENALALFVAAVVLLILLRTTMMLTTRDGRRRLGARASRALRPEFWPPWILYAPLVPLCALLMIRYRGFPTICAANPGIPEGGFIGESKLQILDLLPAGTVIPYFAIPPGDTQTRKVNFEREFEKRDWGYPLILKPDVAQRGAGLRLVRTPEAALTYIESFPAMLVAQRYHPGPHEAGIFYVRFPGEERGRIFSITDKVFPVLVGDGMTRLEDLIWRHPRFRLQADTFLARHAARLDEVPGRGERVPLAIAGNHVQGTLFRDGEHLLTPELEAAFDRVARATPGFFFGRFDARYSDVERFRRGEEVAIVELNGATAESTNIYDPDRSILFLYRTLMRQWIVLFQVGHANRMRGVAVPASWTLLARLWQYRREQSASPIAD